MKHPNLVPFLLLIGGLLVALYYVYQAFTNPETEFVMQFAVASLCGVLGWCEIRATKFHEGE